jgi:hypothetical protein
MILRVVKMKVNEHKLTAFRMFMDNLYDEKLRMSGCLHFDYFEEKRNSNVFYSYTIWENIKFLKEYKKSDLFKEVVQTLRYLCSEEPQAWTIENVFNKPSHEDESD